MAKVAGIPTMMGICTSMRMTSNLLFWIASTASCPFPTTVTTWWYFSNILTAEPLVHRIVLGKQDLEGFGVVRERRRCAVFQGGNHAVAEVDQLARRCHVGRDAQVKTRLETHVDDRRQQHNWQVLEFVDRPQAPRRVDRVHDDHVIRRGALGPCLDEGGAAFGIDKQ